MNRDRLIARLAEMGAAPDYPALAREVLGIRGAPARLAERLVAQALVIEDRRSVWRQAGERIVRAAPAAPGVYVLRDANGAALYVGKAVNVRRRLRAHFAERRWRALKPAMARVADAEWTEVGSELEALLREALLIAELQPVANVQMAPARRKPIERVGAAADVILVLPSVEGDSAELVGARADGGWMLQRTRRNGADLAVHARRLTRFFRGPFHGASLGYIVFSWLAHRGGRVTRLRPSDARTEGELRARLAAVLGDERLFQERLDQRTTL
jgi:predicted GIY-YIG superfamily endonuclease